MTFQIDRGLSQFDYADHYAILGLPMTSEAGEIRKRYLQIARSLHPDSCPEANKDLASQLLSKLVNPSYQVLSQERERSEYTILLRLLSQRLAQEHPAIELESESALQLLQTPADSEDFYKRTVNELAQQQYQSLDQALAVTSQLSELNLAYLMAQVGARAGVNSPRPEKPDHGGPTPSAQEAPPDPELTDSSISAYVNQYYRRAELLIAKNNLQPAIVELRDALKLQPQNSKCHSLMGTTYLKLNQLTMAKIHFNQAIKYDSRNAMALMGKEQVEQLERHTKTARTPQKTTRGGLFGLFGGGKK